jgi:Tfp pilus assembly protein PilF
MLLPERAKSLMHGRWGFRAPKPLLLQFQSSEGLWERQRIWIQIESIADRACILIPPTSATMASSVATTITVGGSPLRHGSQSVSSTAEVLVETVRADESKSFVVVRARSGMQCDSPARGDVMTEPVHPALLRAREALAQRDLAAAYQSALTALRAEPRDAQVHALLGIVLSEANDLSSGEWHFRRALELAPLLHECLANLAINLIRQGRAEEAEPYFAHADALAPGNLQVLAQWSKLHELQGDLQRAEQRLAHAADISSPGEVELLRVGYLARRGQHREALAILEAAPELNGAAQLQRGRIYDQLGRYSEAWRDWVEGKAKLAMQTGGVGYEAGAVDAFYARLEKFFVRTNIELLPQATARRDVPQPVFIMGLPRSGTTLIEQVLASHSAVRAGGELTFVGEWQKLIGQLLPDPAPFPENLTRAWSADGHHIASMLRDYYFARAEARGLTAPGKLLFTDKMPFNELWLPLVRMAFPRAKVVRIVRHPLDVCVSMLSHELTHGFHCGYRIETIVHQVRAMLRLTDHYCRELDSSAFLLRYEDFVREPERETRRLLAFLELPFETACLDLHERRRYGATPSYAQVAEKINDRSIDRYRNYREHLEPFARQLAPALAALGYGDSLRRT